MSNTVKPAYIPASYSRPPEWKERIEQMARAEYCSPSVIMRRLLAQSFADQALQAELASKAKRRTKRQLQSRSEADAE